MILPVVLIALLLCVENNDAKFRRVTECKDWACFALDSCLGLSDSTLYEVSIYRPVVDDCSGILMIKPRSKNKWEVIVESWNAATTDLTVKQGQTELFSCKNEGSGPKTSSSLPGLEEITSTSSKPLSCQFLIGDDSSEVISAKNKHIVLASSSMQSSIDIDNFLFEVGARVTCDQSHVHFEGFASAEDVVKKAYVQFKAVSCPDAGYNLQYKTGSAYEDITAITCFKVLATKKYQYKTSEGTMIPEGPFHVRCYAKVSSFCDKPMTPAGKIEPQFANNETDYNSKTLSCPKFFKVDGEVYREKAICKKIEENEFKWTIGNTTVNNATEVECVEKMPCIEKVMGCTGDCKLNATTGMPYCPQSHTLSVTIDGKDPIKIVSVHCDTDKGTLLYEGEVKGYLPYDMRGVSFNCTDMTPPDVAFYRQPWFERTYDVLGVLAGILSVAIIVYMIWAIPRFHREKRAREAKETIKESSNKRFLKISDR